MPNPKAYTASGTVFVEDKLYKAGEVFVTDKPKGDTWEEVTKAEKAAIDAAEPVRGDPPLEGLSKGALQAIAWIKRVDPTGLRVDDLISAIKAADEPTL